MYVYEGKVPVLSQPNTDADTSGFVYYLDKVLVINNSNSRFGWQQIIYPVKGFVDEKLLMTPDEKKKLDIRLNNSGEENKYSQWEWEVRECPNDYVLVKETANENSQTLGYLSDGEKFLYIKDNLNGTGIWTKIIYPDDGYIKTEDMYSHSSPVLSLGFSYGALNIPYEKNLKKC